MTRPIHMWHDLLICDMTCTLLKSHIHDSLIWDMTCSYVTRPIHMWHDLLTCDMTCTLLKSRTESSVHGACSIWMGHAMYESVMSYTIEYVPYERFISHMDESWVTSAGFQCLHHTWKNESCHVRMSHSTYERVTSYMNESVHVRMSHTGSSTNFRPLSSRDVSKSDFKNGHISRFCIVFQVIQVISSEKVLLCGGSWPQLHFMNDFSRTRFQRLLFGKQTVKKFFNQMF